LANRESDIGEEKVGEEELRARWPRRGEWPVGKLDLRAGVACGGEDGVEEVTGCGGGAGGDRQRGRGRR
jgi:hypothetical protein